MFPEMGCFLEDPDKVYGTLVSSFLENTLRGKNTPED